jgi:hypothetical protein
MEGMKMGYVVVYNSCNSEIGRYEIDSRRPVAEELVRIIKNTGMILYEGDTIKFE